jgi:hypothetical protein
MGLNDFTGFTKNGHEGVFAFLLEGKELKGEQLARLLEEQPDE